MTVAALADALFLVALCLYAVAVVVQLTTVGEGGRRVAVTGLVAHGGSVVARGVAGGHLPWATMYEFSSVVALVAVLVAVRAVPRDAVRGVLPTTLVGAAATMVAALALREPAAPAPPALASVWLGVHTTAAITASGIFTVGAAATAVWLWRDGVATAAAGPPVGTPRTAQLAAVGQRVTALGFLVWTFAVLTGAVWAEQAWGRYWGWDPKETAAFATWLLYASALHAQATVRWRGRRAAWIALAAYASLLVTYYVVNLVVVGLHSYV